MSDMCIGPHLCYTKALKAFKVTQQSGAYWKNDKNNKMLTRINGIAFRTQEELDEHLKLLEEAARRDHRKIGKEMGLFMFRDEGPGFPFFLPNGMILKNTLIDYWRELHSAAGYVGGFDPADHEPPACGRPPATGTIIKTTCTRPRSTTRTTASSR